jgi:hypothetical protein
VPTLSMPGRPHLDGFRRQARTLQRAVRAGDIDSAARINRQHPGGVPDDISTFPLSTAQLGVAREHGFATTQQIARQASVSSSASDRPDTPTEPTWTPVSGAVTGTPPPKLVMFAAAQLAGCQPSG